MPEHKPTDDGNEQIVIHVGNLTVLLKSLPKYLGIYEAVEATCLDVKLGTFYRRSSNFQWRTLRGLSIDDAVRANMTIKFRIHMQYVDDTQRKNGKTDNKDDIK